MDNRAVIMNPVNSQLEKQMICELLLVQACSIEKQRFYAMQIWATKFPKMSWSSGSANPSMVNYLDNLINRAKSYQPEIAYDISTLMIYPDDYKVRSFKNGLDQFKSERTSFLAMRNEDFQAVVRIGRMKNVRYFKSIDVISGGVGFRLDESMLTPAQNG